MSNEYENRRKSNKRAFSEISDDHVCDTKTKTVGIFFILFLEMYGFRSKFLIQLFRPVVCENNEFKNSDKSRVLDFFKFSMLQVCGARPKTTASSTVNSFTTRKHAIET